MIEERNVKKGKREEKGIFMCLVGKKEKKNREEKLILCIIVLSSGEEK
jgi:hypothetical protein